MPVAQRPPSLEFKPPSKKVIVIISVIAILVVLASILPAIATFYTDSLLFKSLGQSSTFTALISAKAFVPLTSFVVMTLLVAGTIYLATRLGKKNSLLSDFDDWVKPIARVYRARKTVIRSSVALLIGFFFAGSTTGHYKEWILFRNSQPFGTKDPLFKKDIGFYVFDLPMIRLALGWLFSAAVVILLVTVVAHYINGGMRFEKQGRHISVAAKVHLSIVCAVAGLIKAAQYYFDRFALVHSTRGAVDGATYTDVNASLPATRFLIFVAVIAAILFIVNVYRKGIVLPLVAIALWLVVSIIVGTVYPVVVQTFVVKPSRNTKEKPYTVRNIAATREAFGIESVDSQNVNFEQNLTTKTAPAAKAALADALLWSEDSLKPWVQQKRGEQIYEFDSIDRDRYKVDGKIIPAFISARELVPTDKLPDKSWPSKHATYSHGFGAAITDASGVITDNEPDYLVSDLPSKNEKVSQDDLKLNTSKARIYFGEGLDDFVFVGSTKAEQTPTKDEISVKDLGGVPVDSIAKKAAFALRFSDFNILIADTVTNKSKIVYERNPVARVKKVAPFLDTDSDPYPVVTNGEVVWVIDAYTTSDQYPYSQYLDLDNIEPGSGLNKKVNYVRNSVKATVNARTGKVMLYVVDRKDPIIKAYEKAFPKLFTDVKKAPQDIKDHFRYPEDLYNAQTQVYGDYHVTDPITLLKGSGRWQVAPQSADSATPVNNLVTSTTTQGGGRADKTKTSGTPLAPLYQYIAHTGMKSPEFLLTRAFIPINTTFKMDSFMSVSSDGDNYGKMRLVNFEADADTSALSPSQMIGQITSDKEFSQQVTLLDQRGSTVNPGALQIVPVGNTVLYVQPFFVKGNSSDSRPVLTYVTVSVSGRTVCAPSIDEAIDALVTNASICVPFTQTSGTAAPTTNSPSPTTNTNNNTTTDITKISDAELVNRLVQAGEDYEKAKDPLDLGALQKAADKMNALIAELKERQK